MVGRGDACVVTTSEVPSEVILEMILRDFDSMDEIVGAHARTNG